MDIETEGLDATKFVLGSIARDGNTTVFTDKNEMWNTILALGAKEKKRGHNLYVYGHNHEYDFYGYADKKSKKLTYVSLNPFMVILDNIHFYDTWALSRMPLKDVGKAVGLQKMEMPEQLMTLTKEEILSSFELINTISEYCKRDAEITLRYVKLLKHRTTMDGYRLRKLITLGQIGVRYLSKHISTREELSKAIFSNARRRKFHETIFKDNNLVRHAYRGGMVRAFKTGQLKGTGLDVNSLYPYSLSKIPIPILNTESFVKGPSVIDYSKIGTAKVLLRKPTDHGSIGVRQQFSGEGQYSLTFPMQECHILGTYTLLELENFLRNGCDLIDCEWVIYYDKAKENLAPFVHELYEARLQSRFASKFYKMVLNNMIGKLCQNRDAFDIMFDGLDKSEDLEEAGYKLSGFDGTEGVFKRSKGEVKNAYYCPIIPAYVNAYSRCFMNSHLRRIPIEDLIYMDTDSIYFKGQHEGKFRISNKMGDWKLEHKDEDMKIYGKKSYRIGDRIKLAGVPKRGLNREVFDKGEIETSRMTSIFQNPGRAGEFTTTKRQLSDTEERHIRHERELSEKKLLVDLFENDLDYFRNIILEVCK